jgi:DNA invertase Pin-like site-specific DNA recombinase
MSTAISYLRVSTVSQGKSGLGLEAQRAAIQRFAEAEGIDLVAEHVEIETGKGADALDRRPVLAAALGVKCDNSPAATRRRLVRKLQRNSRETDEMSRRRRCR